MGGGGAEALHEYVCGLPEDHTAACQSKAGGEIREFETIGQLQSHLGKTAYAKLMAAKKKAEQADG